MTKKTAQVRTLTRKARTPAPEVNQTAKPQPDDDLYAVAMLKVAMELKKGPGQGFDEVFESTLESMSIDRDAFKRYLDRHLGRLMKTARRRGY